MRQMKKVGLGAKDRDHLGQSNEREGGRNRTREENLHGGNKEINFKRK
jgi:hypothetical protein